MILFMKTIIASPRMRMLIAGGISLAVAYATFLSLIAFGIHYLFASVVNFLTYLVVNFCLNKLWAFRSKGNTRKQAVAHASLHLGNQIMIMLGLYLLVELVEIPAAWSQIIMQLIAFVVVFILTPIIFKPSHQH
jgi:putative flippase GtrA